MHGSGVTVVGSCVLVRVFVGIFSTVAAWRWLRRVSVGAYRGLVDYLSSSLSSQVSIICRCRLFRPCLSRIALIESHRRTRHARRIVAASRRTRRIRRIVVASPH